MATTTRAPGGAAPRWAERRTVPGGWLVLPGGLGLEDHVTDFSPPGRTIDSAYFAVLRGRSYFAAGVPDLSTGGMADGYRWTADPVDAALLFESLDLDGVATERIAFTPGGLIVLGDRTDGGTPALKGGTAMDEMLIRNGPDDSYLGLGAGFLRAYKTDAIWGLIQAQLLTTDQLYELPPADGTLALREQLVRVLELTGPTDVVTVTTALTTVQTLTVPAALVAVGTRIRLRARLRSYRSVGTPPVNVATWTICIGTTFWSVVQLPAYCESDEAADINLEIDFEVVTEASPNGYVKARWRALQGDAALNGIPYYDTEAESVAGPDTSGSLAVIVRVQNGDNADESWVERAELTVVHGGEA